jgi:alpha-L-rhamnosidase
MKHMQRIFFVAMVTITSCSNNRSKVEAPIDLVVSGGFKNPLGFYNSQPSFSWKLPVTDHVKSQLSYRIVVANNPALLSDSADLCDTKKVDSDQYVWVKYEGAALESR